jgi:hypothetical protein
MGASLLLLFSLSQLNTFVQYYCYLSEHLSPYNQAESMFRTLLVKTPNGIISNESPFQGPASEGPEPVPEETESFIEDMNPSQKRLVLKEIANSGLCTNIHQNIRVVRSATVGIKFPSSSCAFPIPPS